MDYLDAEVRLLLDAAIAPSSSRTYDTGVRSYLQFCAATSTQPFPATEDDLLRFIASVRRRLSYKTIKVYLAGVQYKSALMGLQLRLHRFSRLHYALRGIRRLQGSEFSRPPRSPITLDHLSQLLSSAKKNFHRPDDYMITAAVLVAFFALLRSSEYTCPETRHYDPECALCFQDVQFEGHFQFAQIRISKSKTDPFRLGCDIKVWRTGGRLCPVKALRRFIQHHPVRQGPLFTFRDGSYLTRTRLASIMRSVLHDVDLNTHSFRIGGASAAAAAGIPDSTIQVMGRWASNAYRVYLRTPDTTFRQAAYAMSQRHSVLPLWNPHERDCAGTI